MNDIDSSTKSHKRSARGERILKKQGPLLVENDKKVLVIKGHKTSAIINDLLKDLAKLFKPLSKVLSKKNDILPFEDINSLEFLSQKNDCSLFTLGSHTKKRPNNLIIVCIINTFLLYSLILI
jgi:ribosome production factor 2